MDVTTLSSSSSSSSLMSMSIEAKVTIGDIDMRDGNKRYTVYKVVIERSGRSSPRQQNITVLRRYTEFLSLYEKLKKKFPKAQLKLPGKRFFRNFDPEVIRTRRDGLKEFVLKLISRPDICKCSEVLSFFNLSSLDLIGRPKSSSTSTDEATDDEFYPSQQRLRISEGRSSFEAAAPILESGTERRQVKPADFEFLRVIGKGSFGKVLLARLHPSSSLSSPSPSSTSLDKLANISNTSCNYSTSGDPGLYAIKVLNKRQILAKNETRHIMCEKSVLTKAVRHPFLVGLHFSFQTPDKLYLVMDYVSGGELFFHLQRERRFSESRARFYSAEIVSALGYLHSHNIIYRDLKPENILLDRTGHVALTDFGLCVEGSDQATTFCGTPEYLAPEVLLRQSYDRMVDWWCLGAVLFEIMFGLPPFYSRNKDEMYDAILNKPLEFNSSVVISEQAHDILTALLAKDRTQRLGADYDVLDIKGHSFFSSIDWQELELRHIQPPFIPNVTVDPMDVCNFDPTFTKENVPDSVVRSANVFGVSPSVVNSNETFKGFSYRSSFTPASHLPIPTPTPTHEIYSF